MEDDNSGSDGDSTCGRACRRRMRAGGVGVAGDEIDLNSRDERVGEFGVRGEHRCLVAAPSPSQ